MGRHFLDFVVRCIVYTKLGGDRIMEWHFLWHGDRRLILSIGFPYILIDEMRWDIDTQRREKMPGVHMRVKSSGQSLWYEWIDRTSPIHQIYFLTVCRIVSKQRFFPVITCSLLSFWDISFVANIIVNFFGYTSCQCLLISNSIFTTRSSSNRTIQFSNYSGSLSLVFRQAATLSGEASQPDHDLVYWYDTLPMEDGGRQELRVIYLSISKIESSFLRGRVYHRWEGDQPNPNQP